MSVGEKYLEPEPAPERCVWTETRPQIHEQPAEFALSCNKAWGYAYRDQAFLWKFCPYCGKPIDARPREEGE